MGNRLEGRVVIVTGAGRGIGAEVAKWMAADGASVVVNDLGATLDGMGDSDAPAQITVDAIRDAGGTAVASFDSVAEYESASRVVQTAIDNFGRVDALCHVAGILRDRMVFNMTETEWDGVLQVHLYGAFNMVRNCVPHMMRQKYGRLVLFSSGSGLGASGQANYAAAKEGMVGFARSLSRELAPYGITANAVYPGGATRMTASVPQSTTQLRQQQQAQLQPGQTSEDEIPNAPPEAHDPANNAPKAVYLCSEAAGNITGQVVGISGWQAKLYSPRHVTRSIHKNGRWTLDELDALVPISLGAELRNPVPLQPPRPR